MYVSFPQMIVMSAVIKIFNLETKISILSILSACHFLQQHIPNIKPDFYLRTGKPECRKLNSLQFMCWKLSQSVSGAKMVALNRVAPCRRNTFGLPEHAVWCQISFVIPSKYIQHSHIDTIGLYCTKATYMLPQDIWQKCVRLFCVCSLSGSDKSVLLEKVLLECQRLQYGRYTSGRWRQPWEAGRQRWRWMSLITQMQCFE